VAENIYASITRGGTTIASNVAIRVDKLTIAEQVDYGGANPHFAVRMYTMMLPTTDPQFIRQGDRVTDNTVVDPKTTAKRFWNIFSDPEPNQLNMSWRWVAERQTKGGA